MPTVKLLFNTFLLHLRAFMILIIAGKQDLLVLHCFPIVLIPMQLSQTQMTFYEIRICEKNFELFIFYSLYAVKEVLNLDRKNFNKIEA